MSKTYFNHERKYREIRINYITTSVQLDQAVQCTVYVQCTVHVQGTDAKAGLYIK